MFASSPERGSFFAWREGLRGDTPSVKACGFATFPKGTAFSGGDKISGIAIRRPLGGAGIEQSEMTEGVFRGLNSPSHGCAVTDPLFVAARHLPPARGKSSSRMGPLA